MMYGLLFILTYIQGRIQTQILQIHIQILQVQIMMPRLQTTTNKAPRRRRLLKTVRERTRQYNERQLRQLEHSLLDTSCDEDLSDCAIC